VKGVIWARIVPLVVAVLGMAGAAGLAISSHSVTLAAGTSSSEPVASPVSSVVRACLAPGLAGSPAAGVAMVAQSKAGTAGTATVSRLGAATGRPLASLSRPQTLSVVSVRGAAPVKAPAATKTRIPTAPVSGGVVIRASATMARGLEAEQVSSGPGTTARCESPGTDFWFTGPGSLTVKRIQLYVMNPSSQPADVNVAAFTDAGPLQGSTDTGIAVAPHAMIVQSLATALHGSRVIALHVRTSVGQVVAGVAESTGSGHGGAWLPSAADPATHVLVPGLPGTAGARQLFIAVPGTKDAHITLTAITSRGSYQPTGGGGLDIPGGSAVSVSLPSMAGIPGALKVGSNVPITASVMVPGGQRGAPGVFTAAIPPISEQGVVAYNRSGHGSSCQLVLTAAGQAVSARISETGTAGSESAGQSLNPELGKVVQIKPHHSLTVTVGKDAGSKRTSAFAVAITPLPGSGPLYAGRVLVNGGTLASVVPVPSTLTSVHLPVVHSTVITSAP
jgi:Family of unknown function (DUF5719)